MSGWSMPGPLADAMTVAVLISIAMLALRRIALPEVRIITSAYDYLMLAVAAAPFVDRPDRPLRLRAQRAAG